MTIMASKFLSTPSARRATDCKRGQRTFHPISIHALREEGDRSGGRGNQNCRDFYPRPPRGGRPDPKGVCMSDELFLSTPSARRATLYAMHSTCAPMDFYPRPPRGGRLGGRTFYDVTGGFLSTPSARRATLTLYNGGVPTCISIHALREEGDQGRADRARPEGSISIHALREEGDNEDNNVDNVHTEFLSTPSARRATQRFFSCPR